MVPKSHTLGRVPVSKTDFASLLLLLPVCISPLDPLLLLLLLLLLCVLFPAATAAEVAIAVATVVARSLATTAGT
jgi:hypothetical protein